MDEHYCPYCGGEEIDRSDELDREDYVPLPPRFVLQLHDKIAGEVIAEKPVNMVLRNGDGFSVTMNVRITE